MFNTTQSEFLDICKRHYVEYPSIPPNFLRQLSKRLVDHYNDVFHRHGPTVFNEFDSSVTIWDLEPESDEMSYNCESSLRAPDEFFEHTKHHDTDPTYRHIFLASKNARLPLDCSIPLLKSVLTYHQVAPFFLDPLLTFSKQTDMVQLDLTWCHFKNHDTHSTECHTVPVPCLGRSSTRIQHSFLLRTVEFAESRPAADIGEKKTPPKSETRQWPWRVRQVAACHAFDFVTGKQLWITAKSNNLIKDQIKDETPKYPAFSGKDAPVRGGEAIVISSLAAALETHLIYFRWCEEPWRWFTRDIEDHLRPFTKARKHPIGRTRFDRGLPRTGTALSSPTREEYPPKTDDKPTRSPFLSALCHGKGKKPVLGPEGSALEDDSEMHQEAYILSLFSHKDLQTLTLIHRRVEEGRAILESNRRVLERICQRYQDFPSYCPDDMSEETMKTISNLISRFFRSTKEIIRDLETWEAGLTTLRTKLEQGDRPMFESILQLRGSHASRMFEEHAHKSSITMQIIAHQGRRLAKSTHIVTVIAFWLLWVGLAAAVLQSGIIEWDADDGREWRLRRAAISAFVVIAVPGTLGALLGWWLWKRQSDKKDPDLSV
ncbi:hypothetical protein V8F20_007453 [Naviculisporaceae sp. PSN 640]